MNNIITTAITFLLSTQFLFAGTKIDYRGNMGKCVELVDLDYKEDKADYQDEYDEEVKACIFAYSDAARSVKQCKSFANQISSSDLKQESIDRCDLFAKELNK